MNLFNRIDLNALGVRNIVRSFAHAQGMFRIPYTRKHEHQKHAQYLLKMTTPPFIEKRVTKKTKE